MASSHELHVIYGTGPIGAAIMRELRTQGKAVRMINRSGRPSLQTGTPDGVEFVRGDAYDAAFNRAVTAGATHVYQCAQPAYHEWVDKFPLMQRAILEGAAANDAKLILMENLYMYGDTDGQPLTEDTPCRPHTRKGRVRAQMADAWMDAHRAGRVRATAGRASNFFGPGWMLYADQVIYPALAGKRASGFGNLDLPHSFSYTYDVGRAMVMLGADDRALGRAWHIPSPAPIAQRRMLELIFAEAGQTAKIGAVNRAMMWLASPFMPSAREMVEMMYEWEKPFIMDSSAFTRTFGMQPTPIDAAVRETVAWFRAHAPAERARA